MAEKSNKEIVGEFLNGRDPMERIICIECEYADEQVSVIYVNEKGEKRVKTEDFHPFAWVKLDACMKMFDGDKNALKRELAHYGIGIKPLITQMGDSEVSDRLENGYKFLFYAKRKMSFQTFLTFFSKAKTPIYERKKKDEQKDKSQNFLVVSPIEQYMIYTGKRLFKGYDNYDDLHRLQFDLETQGLDPNKCGIDQIGIRTNRGYEHVIDVEGEGDERKVSELQAIIEFLSILAEQKPDIIAGHNSENFDWNFIIVRCEKLGTSLDELSRKFFRYPIYKRKKETVLKLGGEVEYFKPTIMWGHNVVDSLHAVRRAQAIDSNIKSANLKYVTQFLSLKKENRVYVPGSQIGTIWRVLEPVYAFNNTDGDWYRITDKKPLKQGYEAVSGKYIVHRYLLDDIWETDKVELKLNESNFLIGKMIPTTFQRACTMGTAAIWKLILLSWNYEHGLAVPAFGKKRSFTGGLSRLLKVGYSDRIVKLDYNSLYPSIILTWNIKTGLDISNSSLIMLEYVLSEREYYKGLKAAAGKKAKAIKAQIENLEGSEEELHKLKLELQKWEAEETANDKKQLPLKILGNSYFGSAGSPNIYPLGDVDCAERTTCIGRMSLRLMISHFTNLGYTPIVGDSFTSDTPIFVRKKGSVDIDIKPICELITEKNIQVDAFGREYDYKVDYQALCRSGWVDVKYLYRHKTDKPIYHVTDGYMSVDVTEDHSLFNDKKEKIKPSEITEETKLEFYTDKIEHGSYSVEEKECEIIAKMVGNGTLDRIPMKILNCDKKTKFTFLSKALKYVDANRLGKVALAGLQFISRS